MLVFEDSRDTEKNDDADPVDNIVLLGVHVIKGVRLCAKKGQIRGGGGRNRDF